MAHSLERGSVTSDGEAILWLWEAHNVVNLRLRHSVSTDPSYPKVVFPPQRMCPYCYNKLAKDVAEEREPNFNNTVFHEGESFLQIAPPQSTPPRGVYVWNRTAVLYYLWNFYHFRSPSNKSLTHISLSDLAKVAWPRNYPNAHKLHEKYYGMSSRVHHGGSMGLGFSHVDTGLCVASYAMCVVFLAVLAYLIIRRRRLKRLFLAYP